MEQIDGIGKPCEMNKEGDGRIWEVQLEKGVKRRLTIKKGKRKVEVEGVREIGRRLVEGSDKGQGSGECEESVRDAE